MIFFNDIDPMKDKNVRQAAVMSVDKKLLVDRLLRGYGLPIDTLETPEYEAFDAVDQGRVQSGEGGRAARRRPASRPTIR